MEQGLLEMPITSDTRFGNVFLKYSNILSAESELLVDIIRKTEDASVLLIR